MILTEKQVDAIIESLSADYVRLREELETITKSRDDYKSLFEYVSSERDRLLAEKKLLEEK